MLLAFADKHSLAEGKLPELFEITPSSASWYDARTEATIRGAGFMPSGNVVQFGWVTLPDLPSAEGTPAAATKRLSGDGNHIGGHEQRVDFHAETWPLTASFVGRER